MVHLFQKYKNIVLLTLILTLVAGAWYIYTNRNTRVIPEKADLVLTLFNSVRNI